MIRSITGIVRETGDNYLVVEVNGIGYLVASPIATNNLPIEQKIHLHTYLAVRETALELYGFTDKSELQMFEFLLGIPKVGPKSALQILIQASPALLVESAQKNDGLYLHKLSGIGKKTAENITDYLHKKIDSLPINVADIKTENDFNQIQTDAIDALIALGYDVATARETISQLEETDSTVNSLVTKALKKI